MSSHTWTYGVSKGKTWFPLGGGKTLRARRGERKEKPSPYVDLRGKRELMGSRLGDNIIDDRSLLLKHSLDWERKKGKKRG